jgi:hypothetical protein
MSDEELRSLFEKQTERIERAIEAGDNAVRQEMRTIAETLRQEIRDGDNAVRHEMRLMGEGLRHDIQLVAEGVLATRELLGREAADIRGEMRSGFESLDRRVIKIEQR